jgi:hypothetical protein
MAEKQGNGELPHSQDEVRKDHFGFEYGPKDEAFHYLPLYSAETVKLREKKWLKMLNEWDHYMEKKPKKIKERCRKGIPSSLRHRAWLYLTGAHRLKEQQPGRFDDLLKLPDNAFIKDIEKDLGRTFPHHELFVGSTSQGQTDLKRVLKAFAHHNEEIGYCQAMAPVAATLLLNMPAEDAFWCLVQICHRYLPNYYSKGLRGIQVDAKVLDSLVAKTLPDVSKHLQAHKVESLLFCVEWFMSVFSRTLPWSCVLRIWDIFLFEGVKVLFRASLAVLKLTLGSKKQRQDHEGFYDINQRFRHLTAKETREDILIPTMFDFNVTTKEMEKEFVRQEKIVRMEEAENERKRRQRQEQRMKQLTADNSTDL